MISFAAGLVSGARAFLWSWYLRSRGGSLGEGCHFYEGVKLFCAEKAKVSIGAGAVLQKGSVLAASDEGKIQLGKQVYVGEYSIVSSRGEIQIGDFTIIASHCFVVDFDHRFEDSRKPIAQQGYEIKKIEIGRDVWIGAGCKILKGVTIGEGSVIGAGSVVTKDIPPFSVCAGIPAKVIRGRG